MDYKTKYSEAVSLAKTEAEEEVALQKKIENGHSRKEIYGDKWRSVNINDVVRRFAPGAEAIHVNGKMLFVSDDGRYGIYADIGGGYLRIFNFSLNQYVGLNGENMHNYTDSSGKQHGRSKADFNAGTHFRIFQDFKAGENEMKKVRFTHKIFVPNSKNHVQNADGYFKELSDATVFELSQEEFESLRREKSLFDDFDKAFGTMIDDCEEDRIESGDISQAIAITQAFIDKGEIDHMTGAQTVLQSLKYAEEKGVFWEIINGAELYD